MSNKFLPVLYNNIRKNISKSLKSAAKSPNGNNPNSDSNRNLPSVSKNNDIKIQNVPTIDFTQIKNAIDVPMRVSSFFNRRMQDIFKDLLLVQPTNQSEILTKQPFNSSAEFSEKGMVVTVEMKGFKEEDINISIEGPWLVVEGQSSISVPEKEGGGLHVRHIIRRYEVPPNSDVSSIKSTFKNEILTISIPALQPKVLLKTQKPSTVAVFYKPYTIRKYSTSSGEYCSEIKQSEVNATEANNTAKSSVAITNRGMFVTMNVKGFKQEDIYVKVEGTKLKINVQHTEKVPEHKGGGKYFKQSYRVYEVPANSDLENITAEIVDDNLKISIPTIKPKINWL